MPLHFHINTKFDETLCESSLKVCNGQDGLMKLQIRGFVWAFSECLDHGMVERAGFMGN